MVDTLSNDRYIMRLKVIKTRWWAVNPPPDVGCRQVITSPGSSLDHAVWFHRPARLDEWVLLDIVPHTTAGGRGWDKGELSFPPGVRPGRLTQVALVPPRP